MGAFGHKLGTSTQTVMALVLMLVLMAPSPPLLAQTGELISTMNFDQGRRGNPIEVRDSLNYGLPTVRHSKAKVHIRIWLDGQTIDISSWDNVHYRGVLIHNVVECERLTSKHGPLTRVNNYHLQYVQLDPAVCAAVAGELIRSGQPQLPSDTAIPHWKTGYFGCDSPKYQFKVDGTFSENEYQCPERQEPDVPHRNQVMANLDLIREQLQLEQRHAAFKQLLPKGALYGTSVMDLEYIPSKKETRIWEQEAPKRAYLNSIKDTVDRYLEGEIAQMEYRRVADFHDSFYVTFGTNGRLKRMRPSGLNRPDRYDEKRFSDYLRRRKDYRQNLRKTRRHLRSLLNDVDLSAFELKHPLTRSLNSMGKYRFYDQTKYE